MKDINYFSSYVDIVASLAKNMSGKEDNLDNLILQQSLINGLLNTIQDTKKDIDIQVEGVMQGATLN